MATRLNLLPDPRLESLQGDIRARMTAVADLLDQETFPDVFDQTMRETLRIAFANAGAHEGTVWLVDRVRESLVPVHNTGPDPAGFMRKVGSQPLSAGFVSSVFVREQASCENRLHLNPLHSKHVDRAVGLVTTAQIAVPLGFAGQVRGVVSCVQYKPADRPDAEDPPGFPLASLRHVDLAARVLSRLLDGALLHAIIGWAPA